MPSCHTHQCGSPPQRPSPSPSSLAHRAVPLTNMANMANMACRSRCRPDAFISPAAKTRPPINIPYTKPPNHPTSVDDGRWWSDCLVICRLASASPHQPLVGPESMIIHPFASSHRIKSHPLRKLEPLLQSTLHAFKPYLSPLNSSQASVVPDRQIGR